MLLYCACDFGELHSVFGTKLLLGNLREAEQLGSEAILVVDRIKVRDLTPVGSSFRAEHLQRDAILNSDPYAPPRSVTAAGGIIRHRSTGELLCIQRHGVLDLPKGKLDPYESISACATREITEETGVDDLTQGDLIGTTVHGYRRGGFFEIKTTYWYAFSSESTQFVPEVKEGIESVHWIPYAEAERTLGHATLRNLLEDLKPFNEDLDVP